MNIVTETFLEKYDYWYSINKKSIEEIIKNGEKLISEFIKLFPLKKIEKLTIDEYVCGKGDNSSFCWWVEQCLTMFGDIRGGQLTANQRFGIYYDDNANEYVFKRKKDKRSKFGTSVNEVFANVKKELVILIKGVLANNDSALISSNLNPLFKNKISYLYRRTNQLPIYGEPDLNKLLTIFDINYDNNADRVLKRQLLFKFYKSLNRDDITPDLFMHFIYSDLGYRSILRDDSAKVEVKKKEIKDYVLVDVLSIKLPELKESKTKSSLVKTESYESYTEKKITGKKGEEIVKQYLLTHKNDLGIVGNINCYCEENDYEHCDFSYIDKNGNTIYIEVKATKIDRKNGIAFEMSCAEYDFMMNHIDNYYVFLY